MDFNIEGKEYKFLLLHTHIAEDLCDHRPIYLKFKKTETCYLSETLQFEIPSAKEVERETNLMAPFVYYVKETNNIMINYVAREIPEGIEVQNLGLYLNDGMDYIKESDEENKICEYLKTAPEEITLKLV